MNPNFIFHTGSLRRFRLVQPCDVTEFPARKAQTVKRPEGRVPPLLVRALNTYAARGRQHAGV